MLTSMQTHELGVGIYMGWIFLKSIWQFLSSSRFIYSLTKQSNLASLSSVTMRPFLEPTFQCVTSQLVFMLNPAENVSKPQLSCPLPWLCQPQSDPQAAGQREALVFSPIPWQYQHFSPKTIKVKCLSCLLGFGKSEKSKKWEGRSTYQNTYSSTVALEQTTEHVPGQRNSYLHLKSPGF